MTPPTDPYRQRAEALVTKFCSAWGGDDKSPCWSVLRAQIADALRVAVEEEREALREAVTLADSYLSLVYHRHLAKETVDTRLDFDLRNALGVIRKAAEPFYTICRSERAPTAGEKE